MATFEATAADFWRLAEEARKRELRVLHVPASDVYGRLTLAATIVRR